MKFLRKRELPPLLRAIHDPPARLYLRGEGEPELLSSTAVAIVGARACSPYGAQVARMLGRELLRLGEEDANYRGMATTLTLYLGVWPRGYLLQVGDSRCYLLSKGQLRQLTRDDSWVSAAWVSRRGKSGG